MSMREYTIWKIGALVSAIIWMAVIFLNTVSILGVAIGSIIGCFGFYYWIRILPPYKNVRLAYIISIFLSMLVNKIIGLYWFVAIFTSFTLNVAVLYIALYICTKNIMAEERKILKIPKYYDRWYRGNLYRVRRR